MSIEQYLHDIATNRSIGLLVFIIIIILLLLSGWATIWITLSSVSYRWSWWLRYKSGWSRYNSRSFNTLAISYKVGERVPLGFSNSASISFANYRTTGSSTWTKKRKELCEVCYTPILTINCLEELLVLLWILLLLLFHLLVITYFKY